jgi:putative sterol carrier protein
MKAVKEASMATNASDVILAFFESIAGEHAELPKTISGTLRFELKDGNRCEYWRVTITKGVASSARSKAPADCAVHTDKATLEAIVQGRANPMAALLRGAIRIEGETLLMGYFRSLFTHPAAVHEAQLLAKNTGRAS